MKKSRLKANQIAKRVEEISAKQTTALEAAEATGCSADDRAKHLAAFDALQAEKEAAQADYQRWDAVARSEEWSGSPASVGIVQQVNDGRHGATAGLNTGSDEGGGFDASRVRIPARARGHNRLVAFAGQEREAYAAGLWFAGALLGNQAAQTRAREWGMEFASDPNNSGPQSSLTGLSNQTGGFFVPDVIESKVIEISLKYGVLRQYAEVVPMSSETLTSPRWSAAMTAYWIGRGAKPTSSDPAWTAVQLIARELGAMTKISRQINEDSLIDLGEKVTVNMARAFAQAEDKAGFLGDGTSTYGGISGLVTLLALAANANCLITATGHTTVPALTNADFLKVTGSAPNYDGANWAWFLHKQVWSQSMAALQLAGGGNRVDEIAAGGRMSFLGYPVVFVNVMPAAPTTGTIAAYFADLSMAVKIGDRRGRTVQAGYENDDFTKQLMTLLGTQRVDVNVHTVLDPLGDTNAPGGPVMALKLG